MTRTAFGGQVNSVIEYLAADDITLAPETSVDEHGDSVYGTAQPYKARFEEEQYLFTDANGDTNQIDAVAYVAPSVTVSRRSRLVYDGESFKVHSIKRHYDLFGLVFRKLRLQRIAT